MPVPTAKQTTGQIGETAACNYLVAKGYTILHTNWRSGRAEIDILASYNNIPIFTEVKTRTSAYYGLPEVFVTPHKEAMMRQAAEQYIIDNEHTGEIRYDIISVILKENTVMEIFHIEDAFF